MLHDYSSDDRVRREKHMSTLQSDLTVFETVFEKRLLFS